MGSGGFHTHGTLEPPVSGAGHTLQLEAPCAKPRRWSRHGWPQYMYMVNTHNRDPLFLVIMESKMNDIHVMYNVILNWVQRRGKKGLHSNC